MKGTVACIVLSLAAVGVLGGSFYGEKENAVTAVENKFQELKKFAQMVAKHLIDEQQKTEDESQNQVKETLATEKSLNLRNFAEEVIGATRTAIAKGKPLSVIDCITKVAFEGREAIVKVEENILNELKNIKSRKENTLKMIEYQINLIGTAARDLKEESIQKINDAKTGFQALQADALKKMDVTKKQLEELEVRIHKPALKTELLALKQQISPKLKEVLVNHVKKLQKCQ